MSALPRVNGSGPLCPEVGIVALVPDIWGTAWMSRHQVMTRLARYFNVVWVDPPMGWREVWLPGRRISQTKPAAGPGLSSFHLYRASRWLPQLYRFPTLARILERGRLGRARAIAREAGARTFVTYLWRPEFAWALDIRPRTPSCYHVVDEYSYSTTELPVSEEEATLLRRADLAIIHSPGLWERKAPLATHPVLIPNGVDFAAYSTPAAEPPEYADIPHPRIGYVGAIKAFLDMPLLLQLAERHREYSFVFVGPTRSIGPDEATFTKLRALPNVHVLGPRPVSELPGYMQHCDVGIMPYDLDDYTKYIYPLKLHEYLAAGLPAVGTPIRTLKDFAGVVDLASDLDGWSAALARALEPASHGVPAVAARRKVAQAHDWDLLTHRIALRLGALLGQPYLDRVAAAAPEPAVHA